MKRCRAQLSITGAWGAEHLQPGMPVDLGRELAPGFTVADAVAGREDCFDDGPITDEADPAAAADTDPNHDAALTPRQE